MNDLASASPAAEATRPPPLPLLFRLVRVLARCVVRPLLRVRAEGADALLGCCGALLACNHRRRVLDVVLLLAALPRTPRITADRDLFTGFRGALLRAAGIIELNGFFTSAAAIDKALDLLRRGALVCIFPEGRALGGGAGAFSPGAAYLAAKACVPIFPVWLSPFSWRGSLVRVGVPRPPPASPDVATLREHSQALQEAVRKLGGTS